MPLFARRVSDAISPSAKARWAELQPYPTLDTWRNPLTRGLARRLANDAWRKTRHELDFEYRLTDHHIEGVPCTLYETTKTQRNGDLLLYIHGGGFLAGSTTANASMILPACELSGMEAVGIDYALTPEARFPVAYDQIDTVYRSLMKQNPARRIILFGDSIGAALGLSSMLRWRDEGAPLPAGAVFISPALDGKGQSDTHISLNEHDPLFKSNARHNVSKLFRYYAPGLELDDPRISPLHGDFSEMPPMLIHVGTREIFLGDAARLAEKMRKAGAAATLRVFDGMFHLFHMHWSLEEAKGAYQDIAAFIAERAACANPPVQPDGGGLLTPSQDRPVSMAAQ